MKEKDNKDNYIKYKAKNARKMFEKDYIKSELQAPQIPEQIQLPIPVAMQKMHIKLPTESAEKLILPAEHFSQKIQAQYVHYCDISSNINKPLIGKRAQKSKDKLMVSISLDDDSKNH